MNINDLIKKIIRYNKNSNIELINKAYKIADRLLKDKKRLSGNPLIDHCIDVANILSDFKTDDFAICAALIHPIKKTDVGFNIIKNELGEEVFLIIQGLEKLSFIKQNLTKTEYNPDDLRKVLIVATNDPRIILVKLCDKLVNMRELEYLPNDQQTKISREVMDIYAPLAYRLGIGKIKSELEDLGFKYTQPKIYRDISNKMKDKIEHGQLIIYNIKKILNHEFIKENIKAEIHGRVKSVYSIYKKIVDRSYRLDDIKDVVALRLIVYDIDDCYKILKILHNNFRPIQNTFKDYIAMPKPNGYQSLHVSVYDKNNNLVEFQIRTLEMHEICETGIASHFSYKGYKSNKDFDKRIDWIKEILQNESSKLNIDIFSDHIFVFTPKGKMIQLPNYSTPIDFAYYLHSSIGDKCTGAIVNRKLIPLKSILNNGDIVEIITSNKQKPSSEWLKFVKTTKAKQHINRWLKNNGKLAISGYGKKIEEKSEIGDSLIQVESSKNSKINFAKCCNPIPGDRIIGKTLSAKKINIHKYDCSSAKGKLVKANWKDFNDQDIEIIITANDRSGLLAEILNSIAAFGLNATEARGKIIGDDSAQCSFKVKIKDTKTLLDLIARIKNIKNVKAIYLGNF